MSIYRDRPKIDVPLTALDRSLEWISVAVLVLVVLATVCCVYSLPEIVPMHFDAHGIPDRYGSKWWIMIFPVIAGFLWVLLTTLNRYPNTFNYIVRITEENAFKQYFLATRFIRILKLLLIIMFAAIESGVAYVAFGMADSIEMFVLPTVLCAILLPVIWYMVKSFRMG